MSGFILDVNVLFSGVVSQKEIYKALFTDHVCYTPDFAMIELNKYRQEILKKTKLKAEGLRDFTLFAFSKISVVPDYIISDVSFAKAEMLCKDIDPKDVAYIALAEELQIPLLTRDKPLHDGLKAQGFELVKMFDEFVRELLQKEQK
jgi:predicted nucleic acid-binding protein